jgi:D-glycero-alpha-D-manno-heptose-7-phosphate kinase
MLRTNPSKAFTLQCHLRRDYLFLLRPGRLCPDGAIAALEPGDLHQFVEMMHCHWSTRRIVSRRMSNDQIDEGYDFARSNGAMGGKLIGAGDGGFPMFYTEEKTRLRRALTGAGLREVRWHFDFQGTTVLSQF